MAIKYKTETSIGLFLNPENYKRIIAPMKQRENN